ncbi:MAG: FecR family protein [Agriterribacter sp.]
MSESRIWQLSARKLTQDITLEELQELEQLLQANPAIASQLELHSHYFMSKGSNEGIADEEAWQKQMEKLHQHFPQVFPLPHQQKHVSIRWRIAAWAVAALFLISIPMFDFFLLKPAYKETVSFQALELKAVDSSYEMQLPDGSKVMLNKNSHISLSEGFGEKNRAVRLEGEAFFDIAHNAALPFTVNIRSIQIKVLGTTFNVRAYSDEKELQASLFKGSVEITDGVHKSLKLLLKPNEKVTLPINEESAEEDAATPAKSSNAFPFKMEKLAKEEASGMVPEIAWTRHKLVFNSEPLSQVVNKLEKWFDVSIKIRDASLRDERFTGVFEEETIDEALSNLQHTYPFRFTKTRTGDFIIKK